MSEAILIPGPIYFDTNALISAGWPAPSAQFLQLVQQADELGFTLCLPEVVNQELEEHWCRELDAAWHTANSGIERLNKIAKTVVTFEKLAASPNQDSLRAAVRELTAEFTGRFVIVTTTARPLSELLNLAVRRSVTFGEGGRGFQDAVILCSEVDPVRWATDRVN